MPRVPALLVAMALLVGCASAPRVIEPDERAALQSLASWRMTGRVAVAVDGEGGSASMDWRQSGRASDLSLAGPFGAGAVNVSLVDGWLTLEDGRGARLDGEPAREYLAARLGGEVPLDSLRYWLLGVPAPESSFRELPGGEGAHAGFEQAGWRVRIERFAVVDGRNLPGRLTLERDGARVRVAVSRWQLGP